MTARNDSLSGDVNSPPPSMAVRALDWFREPPDAPPITNPAVVDATYRRLRWRVLTVALVGYALFYFTRKNISVALPLLSADLGYTNAELGVLGALLYVSYALSKVLFGLVGDRADGRKLMAAGLMLSALANLFFSFSTSLVVFGGLWFLNGAFQASAGPACAKTCARWFSVSERGTTWAIWNSSHMIGGGLVLVLAGWLGAHAGWRGIFAGPALICMAGAVFIWFSMGDRPEARGLPPIDQYRDDPEEDARHADGTPPTLREVVRLLFTNRRLMVCAAGSLCVYVVRYGALDWSAKYLVEAKGETIQAAGTITSLVEFAGIPGCLAAGWLSDRVFGARRAPVSVLCLLGLAASLVLFRMVPAGHPWWDAAALSAVGFFTYGPQMLLAGVGAADAVGGRLAAAANGVTGLFAYMGAILSAVGTGLALDRWGWDGGFVIWVAFALLGAALVSTTWNVRGGKRAHG
jgi:OPA family sugar phosphate sensor protein UhpC-like MFS transporter